MNVDSIYGKTCDKNRLKTQQNIQEYLGYLGLSDMCLKEIVDPAGS